MSPERWQKATALFHAALEKAEPERDDFLRRECAEDTQLYSEVRAMLDQHARSGVLDRPAATPPGASPAFTPGSTISGRYRIVRFLGRGGMGEVYEAEDLELKERVALKTLLPEIAGDARMIARFKQEIQLSRKIAHPNVCRVFDLARHPADGSSPETIVFLTMELLAGETLAARLHGEGRLPPETALPLLEQMAEGLDAAHRAGVIHRDFKPSNVMLVPGREGERAVITDFGLARNLTSTGETTATMSGKLIGTLDYMAPELLTGAAASVASDIYALGMVAYKMVTGDLPFASETPLAGAILRSKAPVPAPRSIVPEIDPAFDRAIVRALDPEPARRFSSARAFSSAFGETNSVTLTLPVMTRRKWGVSALTLLAVVTGGFAWNEWDRRRTGPSPEAINFYHQGVDDINAGAYFAATRALDQAVQLAPRFSLAHARLAEAWNELDVSQRASQEMLRARREDISKLSNLDRLEIEAIDLTITREFKTAAAKYESMLPRITVPDAPFDVDLGRAYEKAGQPAKAVTSYLRAADGPSHSAAAWLRLAVLYARASDAAKAEEAFQQADKLYQFTSNLEGLTEVAQQRGIAANDRGDLDDAARNLRKAIETARLAGNIQQEISATLRLSTNAYLSGDATLAERLAREALDAAQANQIQGLAIRGIVTLANAFMRKRDFIGAEKYYREALTLARQSSSPRLTALSLLSLSSLHEQLDRFADSADEDRRALAFYEPNGFTRETLQCYTLIGRAQAGQGDYAGALVSFQRSLRMAEKTQDRFQMALAHESMGDVLAAQERYPEALNHYRMELESSTDDQHLGYARLHVADTLSVLGLYPEARAILNQATGNAEKFPSLQLKIARAGSTLMLSRERFSDALASARATLARDAGHDHLLTAQLTRIIGLALIGLGSKAEGVRYCEDAMAASLALDPVTKLQAQIATERARLISGDRVGAREVLAAAQSALATRPESRWRALAIMAQVDSQQLVPARLALEEVGREWGDEALRVYLARPDLRKSVQTLGVPVITTK